MTPRHGPHSWEEFVQLPEDDRRELFDGWFLEVDMPTAAHEALVMLVGMFLSQWARQHGGRVLSSGYKVMVSARRGLMPDLQYYRAGRKIPPQGLTEGAPDLAVEIVSPSSGRQDRVTKLNYYRSIGLPEYWLIDPSEQSLHRFVLEGGQYTVTGLDGEVAFAPETFPGLSIPLSELWAVLSETAPEAADTPSTDEAQ